MFAIKYTNRMKRDVKRAEKRGKDMNKLISTLALLATGEPIPEKYRDHRLQGKLSDFRECHVDGDGDWILMYQIFDNELILSATATGTHQDLFND
ncbi:MAG: type II toxin-antitoxin system YafQ family toxin [Ruminococcus sp.]|jgi:mRNA interferase YafQ|nr:type II toxin-antitoxin system YafQ family toxin [Ruminococcus sp.]